MATFLITFRETLEAALIVWLILSIVSGFEGKFKNNLYIISGVIFWVIFSFLFAYFLITSYDDLKENQKKYMNEY